MISPKHREAIIINRSQRSLQRNNTSGYKGVSPATRGKPWRASVQYRGIRKFACAECVHHAAKKYNDMVIELNTGGVLNVVQICECKECLS